MRVQWRNGFALFEEDRILCKAGILRFYVGKTRVQAEAGSEIEHKGNRFYVNPKPEIVPERSCIRYSYKGKDYSLQVKGGEVCPVDDGLIELRPTEEDGVITLLPMP